MTAGERLVLSSGPDFRPLTTKVCFGAVQGHDFTAKTWNPTDKHGREHVIAIRLGSLTPNLTKSWLLLLPAPSAGGVENQRTRFKE
jgi:hypothetical protein